MRLAKFNVDDRQQDHFLGLPTPAMALFVASLPFAISEDFLGASRWLSPTAIIILCAVLSLAMLAKVPLISLKFKDFTWKSNSLRIIFVVLAGVLLLIWRLPGIALVISLYVVVSVFQRPKT